MQTTAYQTALDAVKAIAAKSFTFKLVTDSRTARDLGDIVDEVAGLKAAYDALVTADAATYAAAVQDGGAFTVAITALETASGAQRASFIQALVDAAKAVQGLSHADLNGAAGTDEKTVFADAHRTATVIPPDEQRDADNRFFQTDENGVVVDGILKLNSDADLSQPGLSASRKADLPRSC